jgi:hypothetical protein
VKRLDLADALLQARDRLLVPRQRQVDAANVA